MEPLYGEICRLIELLDTLSIEVLENDYQEYDQNIMKFSEEMINTFPRIIKSYTLPEFKEVASDVGYWSSQLEQLLMMFQTPDQFKFIDTMNFETKENLILYSEMIKNMEIDA
ncbi:MAG: hypothetical protein Q4G60_01360 [bacterium]|nr:hypothetical protein [bacterium]